MQQLARLSFRLSGLRTGICDSPKLVAAMLLTALIPLADCGTASPPTRQADICEVFQQYPDWYDYAWKGFVKLTGFTPKSRLIVDGCSTQFQ